MIEIRPAIDIIEGKCVRLTRGEYSSKKIYNEDPLEVARSFQGEGLKRVHVVDLDGAKAGRIINYKTLERIASKTSLLVDFGGGLSSLKDVEIAFECGVDQITLGSLSVHEPTAAEGIFTKYGPERIILGADVKDERVMVKGWEKNSGVFLFDHLHSYQEKGAKYVICTEISKDGALEGPAFDLYKKIKDEAPSYKVIASGGVSNLNDIEKLEEQGVFGVIVGKAIYEGLVSLSDLARF